MKTIKDHENQNPSIQSSVEGAPSASHDVESLPSGIKLRPCPFCGHKPSLGKGRRLTRAEVAGEWWWKPGIKCTTCKIDREFESVEEAVAWWNKRAGDKS